MEKLVSAMPFYYGSSEEAPNTAVVTVTMKDEVDGALLEAVVARVMKRYPHFMVKPAIRDNEYILLDNDSPVVVKRGTAFVPLGGEASNGHLLSFSYEGTRLSLAFFHGLSDGAGIFPLIRSVLYYYCCEYYHTELSPEGIQLLESEISAEERDDPYPQQVDESIQPIGRYKGKPAFQLKNGGRVTGNQAMLYNIRIPEDAFIKYTKAKDGSPATMTSVFLYKAIRELHPCEELPVVCGMAMNIRPVLGTPKCHHSVVSQLFLEYRESMKNMDIKTLATCSRGMVMLQSQPENVWTSVKNNLSFFAYLKNLPDIPSKKEYMKQIVQRSMAMDTYKVSYVGKAALGSVEPYVTALESCVDITGAGIMVEVNSLKGWFHLCFMQEFEEDIYVKSFIKQMEKEGIPCTAEEGRPLCVPGICF